MASFADAKAMMTKAFLDMDKDGNGYIDMWEVEQVFREYYKKKGKTIDYEQMKEKVVKFMNKVDQNGDKQISLDEFLEYFLKFS